jgi:hypothetical protein
LEQDIKSKQNESIIKPYKIISQRMKRLTTYQERKEAKSACMQVAEEGKGKSKNTSHASDIPVHSK